MTCPPKAFLRALRSLLALLGCFVGATGAASADLQSSGAEFLEDMMIPKLALVIGQSSYKHLDKLPATPSDAALIGQLFASLGFDTIVRIDLTHEELANELNDLHQRVLRASRPPYLLPVVTIYYSGHGFAKSDREYVTDIDWEYTEGSTENVDAPLTEFTVDQLVQLTGDTLATIVFVDACRTVIQSANPVGPLTGIDGAASPGRAGVVLQHTKGVIAGTDYVHSSKQRFFVSYASDPGTVANSVVSADVQYSPYSFALNRSIGLGADLYDELVDASNLLQQIKADQTPDPFNKLSGHLFFYFNPTTLDAVRHEWKDHSWTDDRQGNTLWVMRYLDKYIDGPYSVQAQQWIDDNRE